MSAITRALTALSLLALLAACAGTGQSGPLTLAQKLAERNYRLGEPVERIYNYRVNGWNYLDRQHVILLAGASDRYLVTLRRKCYGLANNEIIAYTTTVNQLTVFDKLLVKDASRMIDQCWIQALHKLHKEESAGV